MLVFAYLSKQKDVLMEFKGIDRSKSPPEAIFNPEPNRWFTLGLNTRRRLRDFVGLVLRTKIDENMAMRLEDPNLAVRDQAIAEIAEQDKVIPGFYSVTPGSQIIGKVAGRTVRLEALDGEVREVPHLARKK
jgi:hypothetical protein